MAENPHDFGPPGAGKATTIGRMLFKVGSTKLLDGTNANIDIVGRHRPVDDATV